MINWWNLIFLIPKPDQPPLPFFYILFLADLKLKKKWTNKPWHDQFKSLFILRFLHRRHFHCLKLFETLHLPENENKQEVSKIWVVRKILIIIKKINEGASSTRPSRKNADTLQMTWDIWHTIWKGWVSKSLSYWP